VSARGFIRGNSEKPGTVGQDSDSRLTITTLCITLRQHHKRHAAATHNVQWMIFLIRRTGSVEHSSAPSESCSNFEYSVVSSASLKHAILTLLLTRSFIIGTNTNTVMHRGPYCKRRTICTKCKWNILEIDQDNLRTKLNCCCGASHEH